MPWRGHYLGHCFFCHCFDFARAWMILQGDKFVTLEKYKLETPWPWSNLDITRNSPPVTLRATPWRSHLGHCRQVGNKCPSPTGQAGRIAELTRKTFLQIAAYFTYLNGALHKFLSLSLYLSFFNKICNLFYSNQEDISSNCSIFYIFEWGSP